MLTFYTLSLFCIICTSHAASSHKAGDKCDPKLNLEYYANPNNSSSFLACSHHTKKFELNLCPGTDRVFIDAYQQCVPVSYRTKRQPFLAGSSRVGERCFQNIDCLDNMFCNAGVCACRFGYVEFRSYCYPLVNPGQSGCQYDQQCTGVWPGTTCAGAASLSIGTCTCPATAPRAVETRDGFVCALTSAVCPLPEGAETSSVLLIQGATARTAANFALCSTTSTNTGVAGVTGTCHSLNTGGDYVGDLYDCVPDTTGSLTGICCPSRALTCTLPQLAGTPGGNSEIRYWYNSVEGICSQFAFFPLGGSANANNFKSITHCMTYCAMTCPRGKPQYNVAATLATQRPTTCSGTTSATCADSTRYQCQGVSTSLQCCPKPSFICSAQGGLTATFTSQGSLQYNPGYAVAFTGTLTRYYYDATTKDCMQFNWNQQGGNFNNFATRQDCFNYCQQLFCPQGLPLADANGRAMSCSSAGSCPTTYTCTNGYCCPSPRAVCILSREVGTCNNAIPRFWYNPQTKQCEYFIYSGCQGNSNNFRSELDCYQFCRGIDSQPLCTQGDAAKDGMNRYYVCSNVGTNIGCPNNNYECVFDAYTCSLTRDAGRACGVTSTRWYYDQTLGFCSTFSYNGCDGNSNNFPDRSACENYCGSGGCPNGGQPFRETSNNLRICTPTTVQFQLTTCPAGYDCTTLSGNNFGSGTNLCCPSRAQICRTPPTQSTACGFSTATVRYFFNGALGQCMQFTGCADQLGNNFATLTECSNFCDSAACLSGEVAQRNPNTNQVLTCNPSLLGTCNSIGYTCRNNPLRTSEYVCCGTSDMGVCPAGERAFIDASTQRPRTCQPHLVNPCPDTSYSCRPNANTGYYYCCSSSSSSICPAGKIPYVDTTSGQFQRCTLNNVINACQVGYSCQSAVANVFQGYCCTVQTPCAAGGSYYIQAITGQPRTCSVSFNACLTGFYCAQVSNVQLPMAMTGFCCTNAGTSVCGSLQPYTENGIPRSCYPGSTVATCPGSFQCTRYLSSDAYFCCGTSTIGQGGECPVAGQTPLYFNSAIRICSGPSDTFSCLVSGQTGYTCQYSSLYQRWQCCGGTISQADGCPAGLTALRIGGAIQPCTSGGDFTSCLISGQSGYSCQYSSTYLRFQCCGGTQLTGSCPVGQIPYRELSGLVRQCNPSLFGATQCPTGYTCVAAGTLSGSCCGTQAGCPANSVAQMQSSALPQTCSPNALLFPCNFGFTCTLSQLYGYICCSSTNLSPVVVQQARCPSGMAALQDGAGSDVSCSGTSCAFGYTCQVASNTGSQVCCPSSRDICNQALDSGFSCSTRTVTARYYYSVTARRCTTFSYSGCGGNGNNFFDEMSCTSFCSQGSTGGVGVSCPIFGQTPLMVPGTNRVRYCTPGIDVCPGSYTCQYTGSTLTGTNSVCCGSGDISSLVCSGGGTPWLTGSGPYVCTNNFNACPRPLYNCVTSSLFGEAYCCQGSIQTNVGVGGVSDTSGGCPSGAAILYPWNQQPLACPTGSGCPGNSVCRYSATYRQLQCCTA